MSTTNKNLNNDRTINDNVSGGVINESVETQSLTVNGTSTLGLSTPAIVDSNGLLHVDNATDATSSTDGCAFFDGGIGIAKKCYIGTTLDVTGTVNDIVFDAKNVGSTQSIIVGDSTTGANITTSDGSVAIGNGALATLISGNNNIAIGTNALNLSTTGNSTAIGDASLASQTSTGSLNLGIGTSTGTAITTGVRNICIGHTAGNAFTTGVRNTMVGYSSGTSLTTDSSNNTIVGHSQSATYTNCDNSVFIGSQADGVVGTVDNQIAIGYEATCRAADSCTIGNSSLTKIEPGGDDVCDLGASDKQFKDLYLGGNLIVVQQTPASASATGTANTLAFDADYIYVCTATDIWKRVAIATW